MKKNKERERKEKKAIKGTGKGEKREGRAAGRLGRWESGRV